MFNKFFETINKELNKAFKEEPIQQKCENCGALIEGTNRMETITCRYCGSTQKNNFFKPLFDVNNTPTNDMGDAFDFGFDDRVDDRPFNRREGHYHRHGGHGVYAWVRKGGLFFEGGIPGLKFCKVSLCDTFEECVDKLRQKYYEQKRSAFFEPPVQDFEDIRKNRNTKIIRID